MLFKERTLSILNVAYYIVLLYIYLIFFKVLIHIFNLDHEIF